ncbi:MAG TPA: putative glycoside hydrolase [Longimicrobiales bacterium]|nr:putative glycoside hydrolase [Longimicrobiales bacterium]
MPMDEGRTDMASNVTGRRLGVVIGTLVLLVVAMAGMAIRSDRVPESVDRGSEADASGDALEAGEALEAGVLLPGADAAELVTDADGAAGPDVRPEPAIEWASPSEPSPVTPVPDSERVARPAAVRGIYVGSWPAGNPQRLDRLIRLANETEINAFVIDVKDVTGEVSYATGVPLAEQVGATRNLRIDNIRAVLEKLKDNGIYPIARIVAFKDPLLADARPEWSIMDEDGEVWEDNKGVRWVDSFNPNVWAYNIELAREAIALGFSEIQWDYIRFPDAPQSYMARAVYPAREGRTRVEGIRAFMLESRDELDPLGVPLTADVFGITTSAYNDVGIGQLWEEMADVMDVLLPMVYPSHYPRGTWGYDMPNAAPYQIVLKAMGHGVRRSEDIENAATIRPWLQAFSMGEPEYGPEHIRAQIDAVYDAGLTEWILWDPAVRYSADPLATADGREPWFAGRGAELYERALEEAARKERERERGVLGTPQGN